MQPNIHVLFQFIEVVTLLGEFLLEGMEPVKVGVVSGLSIGRVLRTSRHGMVDILFPLLFVDVDVLLGLFTTGEAVTVIGLAFALAYTV